MCVKKQKTDRSWYDMENGGQKNEYCNQRISDRRRNSSHYNMESGSRGCVAFPQEENLTEETGDAFFKEQTYTGIAVNNDNNEIVGLYILHPNNEGRCGHICNASYAVRRDFRDEHIGEKLVLDCLAQAKENGFRVMQFNAVVANNTHALHLYERIGFTRLGVIPQGFRMPDGHYEDIIPHYYVL